MIRRTQLIQSGVTINDGPTLEQIKSEEEAQNASIDEEIEDVTKSQRTRSMRTRRTQMEKKLLNPRMIWEKLLTTKV